MIPLLWEAQKLGMWVILDGGALLDPAADDGEERERLLQAHDYAAWTRQPLRGVSDILFPPQIGSGLTPDQYAARLLAAESGNPLINCIEGKRLPHLRPYLSARPGATDLAVFLTPEDVLALDPPAFTQALREAASAEEPRRRFPNVVFLGDGPQADALTEAALEVAVAAAERAQARSFLFVRPANEAVRQMQLRVAKQLADRLKNRLVPRMAPAKREEVLASEASSPLLWRLKRYGEVTTAGLEPYVTPDGSTGYNVTGRALLNLAIPNRSAWVDAKRLTRFSMRMFSTVEGQGALLALSTAGEVSFVRVPVVSGWHLYEMDLTKATWESEKPAGQKWGGSTGIVQALTFTPTPAAGSEVAFDWIRLEPDATGEIKWELDKAAEVGKIEGLEGAAVAGGELRGKATGGTVSLELAVPGGRLDVKSLPFLSFAASAPASGTAQVVYWWNREGAEKQGGTATFRLQEGLPAQCADLSRIGFAGATVAGEENWGGPEGKVTRLRLVLPAEKGKDWALDWVRLGPNYDLRAAPGEGGA
jgi:hypothetical protein